MKYHTFWFCVLTFPVWAQQHQLSLSYENDYFNATDRYYTQGVRLAYSAPVFQLSPMRYLLLKQRRESLQYAGLAIERDGFTPGGIRIEGIPYGNRPYAGTMFVSSFHVSIHQATHTRLFAQLDLGMMGPIVGGKEEQTGIHRAIGNILPLGWEYQIANDVVVNYTARLEKGGINRRHTLVTAWVQGRAGTLYTDAALGTQLRLGWMNPYFAAGGAAGSRRLRLYGVATLSGKVVGYNATLQGGWFSNSIYTLPADAIERWVAQGSWGLVAAYNRFELGYTHTYLSPEFRQGLAHGWGQCVLSVSF